MTAGDEVIGVVVTFVLVIGVVVKFVLVLAHAPLSRVLVFVSLLHSKKSRVLFVALHFEQL